jgi:hypothetical protein
MISYMSVGENTECKIHTKNIKEKESAAHTVPHKMSNKYSRTFDEYF